jgi:hypothetical protein
MIIKIKHLIKNMDEEKEWTMRRKHWISLSLCTLLTIALVSCEKDKSTDAGGGGQIVRFEITEGTDGPMTLTATFEFHCIDKTDPNCHTAMYLVVGTNTGGDWMGYPQDHSNCTPFYAIITQGNVEYSFSGSIEGTFGDDSEPFVTGSYTSYDGTNAGDGIFEFYEQDLVEGTSPDCPE